MLESLGPLISGPWIYALVALSVLLDVFVPVLPSGVLVVTAATTAAAGSPGVADRVSQAARLPHELPALLLLGLCATTASVLGDVIAFALARSGTARIGRLLTRSRRLAAAQQRLGHAVSAGGGALVLVARFAPAGRSVVCLGAGTSSRRVRDFLPWSALAGVAWTLYSVGLGYFGGQWLGASWFGTALSVLALFGAGALAAFVVRRRREQPAGAQGAPVTATGLVPAPGIPERAGDGAEVLPVRAA